MTEAGKYVIGKAVWNEGMRGHFIRMFSLTGPQDVEIMVGKIEEEAAAAERERIANLFPRFIQGEMFDETPENDLDLDATTFAMGERFRSLIGAYPYQEKP